MYPIPGYLDVFFCSTQSRDIEVSPYVLLLDHTRATLQNANHLHFLKINDKTSDFFTLRAYRHFHRSRIWDRRPENDFVFSNPSYVTRVTASDSGTSMYLRTLQSFRGALPLSTHTTFRNVSFQVSRECTSVLPFCDYQTHKYGLAMWQCSVATICCCIAVFRAN